MTSLLEIYLARYLVHGGAVQELRQYLPVLDMKASMKRRAEILQRGGQKLDIPAVLYELRVPGM